MPAYKKKFAVPGKKADAIYSVVSEKISAFLEKIGLGQFDLKKNDASKSLSIDSKLFTAKLMCRDGEVELDGNLSLFAVPFKAKIDEGIDRWISKNLNV